MISLGRGDQEQAKTQLHEILRQDTGHRDARLTLAAIARDEGKPDEALEQCLEALEREPRSGEVHLAVGITRIAKGLWEEARKSLEEALSIDPSLGGADFHLARILARLGEQEQAIESLGRSVEKGFATRSMIEGEAAFEDLRGSGSFTKILDEAKA